jgi:D-inositol-3-phosphate glycosyltransferase
VKVVMIEPLGFSGIRYYTEQLSRHLVEQGVQLSLVTSRNYEQLPTPPPYQVHTVMGGMQRTQGRLSRGIDYLLNMRRVLQLIDRERPELVHMQDALIPAVDLFALRYARAGGRRVVYTAHDVDRSALRYTSRWRRAANRAVYQQLYRSAEQIIVHTEAGIRELQADFGVPAGKVVRIDHGNHSLQLEQALRPTKAEARQQLGIAPQAQVALFFGDRRHSKGLDLLIAASAQVASALPNYHLLVAGEARVEHTIDYPALLREAGIAERTTFVDGYIPSAEVPRYFAAADLVVLPYRHIYQSGVVHLAFASGRAVLASRIGGLAEVIDEGHSGFFVADANDTAALAQGLIKALGDRGRLEAMGKQAEHIARTRFAWSTIAATTRELYARLLMK